MFALAGCGHESAAPSTTTTTTTALPPVRGTALPPGPCQPTPPADPALKADWVPADLPLPPGTYPVQELAPELTARRAVFVVPATPDGFAAFAERWRTYGWKLGRPESEGFETENRIARPPAFGGFKVRATYCDPTLSELTLAYSPG